MKTIFFILLFLPFFGFSQLSGKIIDISSKESIYGVKIIASSGQKQISDFDGLFSMNVSKYPVTLILSAQTYLSDTIVIDKAGDYTFKMIEAIQEIKTVVVSAGRRDQNIEDVSISMEIIRPELFENKGLVSLEEAVDQSPGVYAMDGQVSIRGGSGFSYGAGSRVLLLWNGIPLEHTAWS